MSAPAQAETSAGHGYSRLLNPPVAAALNHLLDGASWARARLRPFAGRTVRFDLAPFAATLAILASGEVTDVASESAGDVCFKLTPGVALRMLGAEPYAWQEVQFSGDAALAGEILAIAQNLRWDVEEDLTRVVGDIAAHRMVQAASGIVRWQRAAARSFAHSAAAYWTEEQPLIASRRDIERYLRDVDVLRDDVARAEKRVALLSNHPGAGTAR